jgi:hypothetical protein
MEVRDVRIEDSPSGKERVRLRADVHYETGRVASEEYWFDVPRAHEAELSISGNPWVACLLPLVAHTGESLRVPLPVDRPLLSNAERIMRIWRSWYPQLTVASIETDAIECVPEARHPRVGAFFSGGVDSFFTVVRSRDVAPPAERARIDDLITVWGFDIPLDRGDAFTRLRDRHQGIARELGKQFIDVATNLRSTRWSTAQWSALAHGAGLASVALSLERRFHSVYVAGSGSYRTSRPWGSHAVTDPLFSSCGTAIVFDAAAYLRTEKIEHLARCPTVLRALRVCYELASDENCGICNKCQRTMVTLDLCGALDRSAPFPTRRIDLQRFGRMDCSDFADFRELQDIRALAVETHRADVVEAVDRSVARTRRRRWLRAGLAAIRRPLRSLRHRLRGNR